MDRRKFLKHSGLLAATSTFSFGIVNPVFSQDIVIDQEKLMAPGKLPDRVMGSEDAEITIIEYASMTCPHCKAFHENTFPELKEKYIDTGKVKFVFREFPIDTAAMAASMLARCAPESVYFEVIDLLFENFDDWTGKDDKYNPLLDLARQIGLSQDKFDACLSDQELSNGIKEIKDRAAEEFEVRSTPTLFINGELRRGALSFDDIERILQSE